MRLDEGVTSVFYLEAADLQSFNSSASMSSEGTSGALKVE